MLSVAEARRAIGDALPQRGVEQVPLEDTVGRILRQAVTAERDQPPYDRVTMDGIAVRHAGITAGERAFGIAGTLHAGDPPLALPPGAQCIEVMTGAVLPAGADCVIPVERIERQGNVARLEDGYEPLANQSIHARGSDHRRGHTLLAPGARIAPNDVALLASAGLARVTVSRNPSVTVISTGNELVAAGEPIAAHQVRLSNGPALVAMLRQQGYADSRHEHLADDPDTLRRRIGERLASSDVLVLSGGVSMGQADFVPRVLAELGVRRVFHRIAQRPGKPMWFGTGPAAQAVFALPGNPVSAMVCCRHYVLPALLAAGGAAPSAPGAAVLAADYRFEPDLTCFVPVRVTTGADARLLAEPVVINTSGDFSALSGTAGYVELSSETRHFAAGSVQPLHDWSRP
ncbi:MAG: molybdopterin molybdotransferase MoeA [Woeseiaceae bacterium]|nr:molybdopterin molybdotransferase MoeA [Woeseiaceae bacterium]